MENPPTFPATLDELALRFLRACRLDQTVDWPKIVQSMQAWSAIMNLDTPAVLRIETSGQYLKALRIAGDAKYWVQQRPPTTPLDSWAKRAIHELQNAKEAKLAKGFVNNSPAVAYARGESFKLGGPWVSGAHRLSSNPPLATDSRQDLQWLSIFTLGAVESGNVPEFRKWYPLFQAFEAGALCFFLTDNAIEVCPPPSLIRPGEGRKLHSASGPAFVWLNDVRDYYWDGTRVEPYVVDQPELITAADIEAEPDAEVRQVKIERFKAASSNGAVPAIRTITPHELKERYLRACGLNQPVDWEKITACLRKWAAAFNIPAPRIVPVENSAQLKKTATVTWAFKISPPGLQLDVMARSQGYTCDTWGQNAAMHENGARTYRHVFARSGNPNDLAVVGHFENAAIEDHKKSAASAAGSANAVRRKKITPAMAGAANASGPLFYADGRMAGNGGAAWDIARQALCAIDALEQPHQGTKFSNWYHLFKAFEAGALCFFLNPDGIEVCPLPAVVRVDAAGRLHAADGPAFVWLNDVRDHYWHGVRVEPYVAENPGCITVADIDGETNAEVRRVKIERYGQERYLIDSGAQVLHRDDFGTLYRKEIPNDEPLVMVKVVNATPEPDGSFKDYFLRVPPAMQTARAAVAWTFGKAADDYDPVQES